MKKFKWRAVAAACSVAAAVVLSLLLSGGCVDRIIFQPPQGNPVDSKSLTHLELEPGITIAVRHLPAPPGGYTILYSHGNAEDLANLRYRQPEFVKHGYGIAAYDYEGYGQSGGKPSEESACRDVRRVYDYLTRECGVPAEKIVIYGRSVGSGPSCDLAVDVPAAALVLEAPFTSAFAAVGLEWLPFDRFSNISRIGRINMPVLVIHGSRDQVIAQAQGRALFEKANEPKFFYDVTNAGHNDIVYVAGEEYWRRIGDFLKTTQPTESE